MARASWLAASSRHRIREDDEPGIDRAVGLVDRAVVKTENGRAQLHGRRRPTGR